MAGGGNQVEDFSAPVGQMKPTGVEVDQGLLPLAPAAPSAVELGLATGRLVEKAVVSRQNLQRLWALPWAASRRSSELVFLSRGWIRSPAPGLPPQFDLVSPRHKAKRKQVADENEETTNAIGRRAGACDVRQR